MKFCMYLNIIFAAKLYSGAGGNPPPEKTCETQEEHDMKKALSLILCLVMLGALVACGGGGDTGSTPPADPGSSSAGEAPSTPDAASGDKVDMLLWMPPFGSGDTLDMEFWTKTMAPWAEENNVNLSLEIIPWGNYEEKHLTAFSSGEGPDITYMYNEMINDYIDMGTLEEMSGYFSQEEVDNYLHYDLGSLKGGQYALPFVVGNARLYYFNMDILAEAGITEVPTTWDDFITTLTAVKDANIEGVSPLLQEWADPAIGALNNIFWPYYWQAGGEIFNDDASQLTLNDTGAAVTAAQYVYDLMNVHGVTGSDSLSLVEGDIVSLFGEGKAACVVLGANRGAGFTENGINWEILDSLEGETKGTWVASDSLVMNSASQNKELAASMLKYITSPDVMEAFHTEVTAFPPISKDEEYLDDPKFRDMYENSEYLHSLPVAPNSFKLMDTLYKNLQLMIMDELTAEEAVNQTIEYYNSL